VQVQLDLCEAYPAAVCSYEVIELSEPPTVWPSKWMPELFRNWSRKGVCNDYLDARRLARENCLLKGKECWVVDVVDNGNIVFRSSPEEYTAKRLESRPYAKAVFA
jgi:hypothetical protein